MNHSRAACNELRSKSYVFQNKAKILCKFAEEDPLTTGFGVPFCEFVSDP